MDIIQDAIEQIQNQYPDIVVEKNKSALKEKKVTAKKNYYGYCGSCKYCELGSGYTVPYSTSFKCSRNNYSVKADEKPCNRYEPDSSRTNDMIEKYDK